MIKTTKLLTILSFLALLIVFFGCTGNEINANRLRMFFNKKLAEPKQGTFPGLDAKTELRIKQDYLYLYPSRSIRKIEMVNADRVVIDGYFGTFNGNVVVEITWGRVVIAEPSGYFIAGNIFSASYGFPKIELWIPGDKGKTGIFYRLPEAYELGFLTDEDIKNIHDSYSKDPYAWNPPRFR